MKDKKLKINEIFYSLQGEGRWSGTPMVFIRFSGCNLRCPFCDTNHSKYREMTEEDILGEINKYPADDVCLTGGEPALQTTDKLISLLHEQGRYIHIETNGTKELPEGIDWVTLSPKRGKVVLKRADEIKIVYEYQPLEKWEKFPATFYYVQPCSEKKIKEIINVIKSNPLWKLSLQTQKILKVR